MPGNIYWKTLHDWRGQIAAWTLGLAVLAAANVLLYPSIQKMPGLVGFLQNLPPALKTMIGDVEAMARLEGFLRAKLFDPLPVVLSIFAVSQGATLIAGEVEDKSIDLLLARPVPRWRVALGKHLALVTATWIISLGVVVGLVVSAPFVESEVGVGYWLLATFSSLPLAWLFGSVALFGSCRFARSRQASLLAGVLIVGSYFFETVRLLSNTIRGWDEVSLFAQQRAGFTLSGELHAGPILLLLGLIALVTVAAVVAFERRDLTN